MGSMREGGKDYAGGRNKWRRTSGRRDACTTTRRDARSQAVGLLQAGCLHHKCRQGCRRYGALHFWRAAYNSRLGTGAESSPLQPETFLRPGRGQPSRTARRLEMDSSPLTPLLAQATNVGGYLSYFKIIT
jgi:hypothetical protein